MMSETGKKRGRPRCFEKDEALDAALEVFLEHGYEGSSLDDLTDAIGINRPSLYSAFGNKEKLFVTVLQKYHRIYREYFESLLAEDLRPKETITEWLSWILKNQRNQDGASGCLIVNSTLLAGESYPAIAQELKSFHDLNEKLLNDYFAREKKKGRFSGDPLATSQFYNAIVQGMAVLRRSQGDFKALENIASNAMNAWPE